MNDRPFVTPDHGDPDHSHAGAHLGVRPGGGPDLESVCLVRARQSCPECFALACGTTSRGDLLLQLQAQPEAWLCAFFEWSHVEARRVHRPRGEA